MVILQFFHLTDWFFGFGQELFLINNCSVTFARMTFTYCPTWYLFYGFPTVFSFDGLVLWVRAGAISGQQLQCDTCIDDMCLLSYLVFILWFSYSFFIWRTGTLGSGRSPFLSTTAVWHWHWWHVLTVPPGIYFMVFLQFFHLTDWFFGFGQEPFLANNCSVNTCYTTNNRQGK